MNQNVSHFNATLFSSYTGDKYNMHAFLGGGERRYRR